jgi:hypothetical protein
MRRALVACLLLAWCASASADDDAPPAVAGGVQLVDWSQASWLYQLVAAPRVPVQIGVVAAAGLDAVAGRGSAVPSVLGPTTTEPTGWPYGVDTPVRGTGLLRPDPASDDERIAALFAVTTFELGADASGLRILEVRVRYRDGVRVWLNGLEVVQREPRPHGREWETFYVPVAPGVLRLGTNTLAIDVRPTLARIAPELAVDVVARRDLGIIRGPILDDNATDRATISVETDPNLAAQLAWGVGDGALDHSVASESGRVHRFALVGLPANSRIRYRVTAGGTTTATYAFKTAPAAGDVVRIGVYGDVRGGHDVHRKIIESMLGEPLDVVAVTGDMVVRGADPSEWQRFFAVTRELLAQVRYVPAIGNHDVGFLHGDDLFTLPQGPYWYSERVADVHLVFLDSNAYDRPEQETWLDRDLAAARADKVRAIIVLVHDGPYSRGIHRGNELARTRYVPILAKYHVDLLVAGHDHIYQRGEAGGIRYIVSGGGGAPLYKASCGVANKPKCPEDGMRKLASEHHFLVLTIDGTTLQMCPRKPDGKLLEPCQRYPLSGP